MRWKTLITVIALLCGIIGSSGSAKAQDEQASGFLERYWPAISVPHTRVVLSWKHQDGENVAKVEVEEGQAVKKGDVLIEFDSSLIDARIAIARTQADFEARLKSARRKYEYLKSEFERLEKIKGPEGSDRFVTDVEVEKARYDMDIAELDLQETRRAKKLAEDNLRYLEALREDYTILSPIDGAVSHVWVEVAEMAGEGQQLAEVIDPNVIEVRVSTLPEEYATQITTGQKAVVRFHSASGRAFVGKVHSVSPYVESTSGTFGVKVLVEPGTDLVRPGMGCEVKFASPQRQPEVQ